MSFVFVRGRWESFESQELLSVLTPGHYPGKARNRYGTDHDRGVGTWECGTREECFNSASIQYFINMTATGLVWYPGTGHQVTGQSPPNYLK